MICWEDMKKSEHSSLKLKKTMKKESRDKIQGRPWALTRKTGFLSCRKNFNH